MRASDVSLLAWLLAVLILLLAPFSVSGPGASSSAGQAGGSGAPPAPATVTLADNGRTMTLPVGGQFLLALGAGDWTVHLSDPAVVARVPNVTAIRGAQGIFVAKRPGRTTLSASEPGGPEFRITITVT